MNDTQRIRCLEGALFGLLVLCASPAFAQDAASSPVLAFAPGADPVLSSGQSGASNTGPGQSDSWTAQTVDAQAFTSSGTGTAQPLASASTSFAGLGSRAIPGGFGSAVMPPRTAAYASPLAPHWGAFEANGGSYTRGPVSLLRGRGR